LWAIALMIFRSPIGLVDGFPVASSSFWLSWRLHWPWMIAKVLLRLSLRECSDNLVLHAVFPARPVWLLRVCRFAPLFCRRFGEWLLRSLMHALRSCFEGSMILQAFFQSSLGIDQRLAVQGDT
jgi:hypothetical protein